MPCSLPWSLTHAWGRARFTPSWEEAHRPHPTSTLPSTWTSGAAQRPPPASSASDDRAHSGPYNGRFALAGQWPARSRGDAP